MVKNRVYYGVKIGGKLLSLDADYTDPISVNIEDMDRLLTRRIKVAKRRLREHQEKYGTKAGKVCVVVISVTVT